MLTSTNSLLGHKNARLVKNVKMKEFETLICSMLGSWGSTHTMRHMRDKSTCRKFLVAENSTHN